MRARNLASVFYASGTPPTDAAEMQRFLFDELKKISAAIDALSAGHLDKVTVSPSKPRDGDIRYADGINFKPNGTGAVGIWYYNGTTWVFLG